MIYKVISRDGQEDYVDVEDVASAISLGRVMFGPGISARPAYYGEWKCGDNCGYEMNGQHYWLGNDGQKIYGKKPGSQNQKFGQKDI